MSASRVLLKIICVILTICGLLQVVVGILLAAGSSLPELALTFVTIDEEVYSLAAGSLALSIMLIGMGLINFVIGMLGWRGANRPSKIGPFFWISIIGAVLSVIGLIMNFLQGIVSPTAIVSTIIIVLCAILANAIRNKSKGIDKPKE